MKKKMISLLLILALCLGMTISVSADDTGGFANEYCRVQDQAELMTYSEEAELNDMLDELSVRQKMEVVVVTTNTLDGKTAEEYADDTYDYGRSPASRQCRRREHLLYFNLWLRDYSFYR